MIYAGQGSPEGAVTGIPGAFYLQTDGAVGAQLWQKQTGTAETGWVLFTLQALGSTGYLRMLERKDYPTAAGTTHNYVIGDVGHLHFSVVGGGTHTITGFAGGVGGRMLVLTCEGGQVDLSHASSGSTTGNKLSNKSSTTVSLTPLVRAVYLWDATIRTWYQIA